MLGASHVNQARNQVRQYEQQYRQTVEAAPREATEPAAVATKAVSRGALIAAVSLLLGGVAAWFGGRMGAVDPTITASVRTGPAMGRTRVPMKALVWHGKEDVRCDTVSDPAIEEPRDAIIKVTSCAKHANPNDIAADLKSTTAGTETEARHLCGSVSTGL
jgi:hypothetical protein